MKKGLFLLIFSLSIVTINAQEQISTDRPTDTYSPITIPQKAFQLESGFSVYNDITSKISPWSTSNTDLLLRYGLTKRIELRVSSNLLIYNKSISAYSDRDNSISYPNWGMKINLLHEKGAIPEIGILPSIQIAYTKVNNTSNLNVQADMVLAFSNTLSDKLSLGYNFAVRNGSYSVVLGYNALGNLAFFLEHSGVFRNYSWWYAKINGGILFQPKSNISFDLSVQYLSITSYQYYNLGFSILLNQK